VGSGPGGKGWIVRHVDRRRWGALAGIAAAVCLALTMAPSATTNATAAGTDVARFQAATMVSQASGCHGSYHYAFQFTSHSTYQDHTGCANPDLYGGWIGVDGQIQTPTAVPTLDSSQDHDAGWMGVYWIGANGAKDTWLQIGWYTGIIANTLGSCQPTLCVQRTGSFGLYVEYQKANGTVYHVYDKSSLGLGGHVTYRVQYAPTLGSGCWTAYYNYSTVAATVCGLPTSGPIWVVNELDNNSGLANMASSEFGTATPGTNETLRLFGAQGYQDWNQKLLAGGTGEIDERGFPPSDNYIMSASKLYWDLHTSQN
jgi:hypothetical protein